MSAASATIRPTIWKPATAFGFDREDLRPEHQELGIAVGPQQLRIGLNYLQLGDDPRDGETHRQELGLSLAWIYDQYWTFSTRATRELSGDNVNQVSSGFAVQYQDECLTFVTSLTQSGIRDRDIQAGDYLVVPVRLQEPGRNRVASASGGQRIIAVTRGRVRVTTPPGRLIVAD